MTKSSGSHLQVRVGTVDGPAPAPLRETALLQRIYGIAFPTQEELAAWEVRAALERSVHCWRVFRFCDDGAPRVHHTDCNTHTPNTLSVRSTRARGLAGLGCTRGSAEA